MPTLRSGLPKGIRKLRHALDVRTHEVRAVHRAVHVHKSTAREAIGAVNRRGSGGLRLWLGLRPLLVTDIFLLADCFKIDCGSMMIELAQGRPTRPAATVTS